MLDCSAIKLSTQHIYASALVLKIQELRIKNYKKFADSTFRFNTKTNVTVLIGDNATGKTAILNALAIMAGSYLLDFKVPRAVRHIRKDEVRLKQIQVGEIVSLEPQWADGVQISCDADVSKISDHAQASWSRELQSAQSRTTRVNAKPIADIGRIAQQKVANGDDVLLPVLAYYGTGRLWDKKQETPLAKPESRTVGYRDCLDPASNHHLFLHWFSRLEQAALQKKKSFDVLEAVRSAVCTCIPGCVHFYFDIEFQQLMVEFDDGRFISFDNLSDGYRNMLAIVADIAHRTARLNPQLGKLSASESPGIVLIDEIDLHLHPKWQRHVLLNLRAAFPNIQFIVSTHSPFIIQSLAVGEVIDLNNEVAPLVESDAQTAQPAPPNSYSNRSIEDIIEDIMGVAMPSRSVRLQKMFDVAKQYYALLEEESANTEQEIEQLKQKLDELSAPFSEDVAFHAFLERKRLAAGVIAHSDKD